MHPLHSQISADLPARLALVTAVGMVSEQSDSLIVTTAPMTYGARQRLQLLLYCILAVASPACVPPPDLECDTFSEDLKCPGGQACKDFVCRDVCSKASDCLVTEACVADLCLPYVQECTTSEACAEGFGCDGNKCVKILGGCHPQVAGTCGDNATCLPGPAPPQHFCVCLEGWVQQDDVCADIDECAAADNPCGANTQCINHQGSYTCACDPGSTPDGNDTSCTSGWTAASAGAAHSCGIRLDGSLWCWGENHWGQLGLGTLQSTAKPTQVGAEPRHSLSAGEQHTCSISAFQGREGGTLSCWGRNNSGQLGVPGAVEQSPSPIPLSGKWLAAAAGSNHTCAVRDDNTLWCWGLNAQGQVGLAAVAGAIHPTPQNIKVPGVEAWSAVVAGGAHSCALTADQRLWCWGANTSGQVGSGSAKESELPSAILPGDAWLTIAAGDNHICAVKNGNTLWCWGANGQGQQGGSAAIRTTPMQVDPRFVWLSLGPGQSHSCAVQLNGSLHCWGLNDMGQLGRGAAGPASGFAPVAAAEDARTWSQVASGRSHSCAVRAEDLTLWCWGQSSSGQLGDGRSELVLSPVQFPSGDIEVLASSTAAGHACAVDTQQRLWCWGSNSRGQLGDSTLGMAAVAAKAIAQPGSAASPWQQVAVGGFSSAAIDGSGVLWSWGDNAVGQLGLGAAATATLSQPKAHATPVANAGGALTGWLQVAQSLAHGCGIGGSDAPLSANAGPLFCWGHPGAGRLGLGAGADVVATPQQVQAAQWQAVAVAQEHSCGIQADGSLWCWGGNADWQLGLGAKAAATTTPQRVGDQSDWRSVTVAPRVSCGLRGEGSLWCWGRMGGGTPTPEPTAVGTHQDWQSVATGGEQGTGNFACGLRGGALHCWGGNRWGQLGDGTTVERRSPTLIDNGPWQHVSAGAAFVCVTSTAGRVYCSGKNDTFQGGAGSSNAPGPVAEL